jgi:putative PIN family toxin of toxin-antitoxin system
MLFLQGAARPAGPAAACLRLAEAGHVELYLSADVLAEIRDVLTRPKLQKKFPALTPQAVDAFLGRVTQHAVVLADVPATVTLTRDPKDEKYLNLAVAAGARYLVSRDKDLLDLGSSGPPEAQAFRTSHPTIVILDPVEFLRSLTPEAAARPATPPTLPAGDSAGA